MIEAILDELVEPLGEELVEPLEDGSTTAEPGKGQTSEDGALDLVELDPSAMVELDASAMTRMEPAPKEPAPTGRIRLLTKRAWVRSGVVLAEARLDTRAEPEEDPRTEPVVPGAVRGRG